MKIDGSDMNSKGKSFEQVMGTSLSELLSSDYVKNRFMQIIGDRSSAFISSVWQAVQKNPSLAQCDANSIVSSAVVAATLDLPIDSSLGFAALVPYNTKRIGANGKEYKVSLAQFQIMYKGYIQLAQRSGQYKAINVSPIYEDEFESYDIITGDIVIKPVEDGYRAQEMEEKIVGYVAFFRLLNGFERMEYWSLKKIKAHGQRYSKSFARDGGLWKTNPHAMYAKTVLKAALSKWGILSVTMQNAMTADQAVIKDVTKPIGSENITYIDAPKTSDEESRMETAPAHKETQVDPGNGSLEQQAETSERRGKPTESVTKPAMEKTGRVDLFPQDEEAELEAQFERDQGGPNFD